MECDEEEDASSLLSLSQTFLQPDSSSSSMGLSTNQIHNWSTLTSTAADVAAQFSPISPADGYNTNTTSGQALIDNETNFRFYSSRSAANQSATRNSIPCLFNRPGNSGLSSASNLNSFPPASRVSGNEFNHNSGHMNLDTSENLCYEQPCNLRPGNGIYGDKDSGYFNRGVNGSSNSHTTDTSNVISASFAHAGYSDDHGMLSLTTATDDDDDGKLGNRNVHLDQKMFDSRSKQKEYSKDFSNLYDQSSEKTLQSTEIAMSFDRRDASNFDSSFEFSSDSRDFAPARLDVTSVNRAVQDQNYHQSQKYSNAQTGDGDMLTNTLSLNSKRVSSSYVNFGLSGHTEDNYGRLNNVQKKSPFTQQLNDLPTDLEPVFHGYHTDFGGHQKFLLDSHRNFGANEFQENEDANRFNLKDQTNSRDSSNKWSGRPRAHRKMARLLGSEDHRDYSQVIDASNSNKPSFTKAMSSLETITQDKNSFQSNIQRDLTTNSRTFLTMEEELDLRTNHHQERSFMSRRDEIQDRSQTSQRELGLLQTTSTFSFDSNAMTSMHKDTASSILTNQQFLPTAQLDLDFHATLSESQPQKDLDLNQHFGLQVSKDFGLEASHSASNQDDLSFDHPGDPHHINQPDLTLSDNLGIVSQVQSELSFEAYFNSASERDFTSASDRDFNCTSDRDFIFCRKFSSSTSRDLNYVPSATVNDFNIEDYMNPQKDLSQSYFTRPDLPQDMTLYQKVPNDKATIPETPNSFKGREKSQGLTTDKDKQGEISELQKELTKTSTKESMKGIRIPRDINRAMEILQGLQEDEREEERRKELQQKQQQHQQLQSLISSPKKTFQNKHNIESLSLTDQQFLGSSGNFIEDQSVGSFLDHTHLTMSDQPQDSLQMVQSYQPFTQINQSIEVEMVSTLPGKRDLHQNLAHNETSDLDYHILKRLACSSSMKGITKTQGSTFSNNSTNLASILAEQPTHDLGMQFPVAGIHFQTQQHDLEDVSYSILNSSNSTLELSRSKNELAFMDFEPQQPQHSSSEKQQTSIVASDPHHHSSIEVPQIMRCKQEADVLILSRKNLYDMMKREQFCDAVLSTSKQTVKVHQVVLCSMSQYLTTLLHKMKQTPTSKGITQSSSCYSSQATRNLSILLVVNCDGIKSSSVMTFLLYIYLGRAELSESNVLDMYMLACSLRVQPLKDLCKDFMWQAHIPNEQLKIPQLLVSSQRLETQDQSIMTEIITEDKSTNTPCFVRGMEVATQTDRSTSEAGEGGQEEWVMLKKTKQKTVSPSKSRLVGKSLTSIDSPIGCKTGKKGWLSPKRRYKTENQIEGKATEKETSVIGKDFLNFFSSAPTNPEAQSTSRLDVIQNLSSFSTISEAETKDSLHELVLPNIEMTEKTLLPVNKQQSLTPKKSARTTVEIAAAAAAAKIAAHSYGTRTARGIAKIPISYASLAFGLEKKKSFSSSKEKTVLTMSKKKDFIKSNPETEFSPTVEAKIISKPDQFTFMMKDNILESSSVKADCITSEVVLENVSDPLEQQKTDENTFKFKTKQPFKKSIVHRSRSEDVLNKNYAQLVSSLPARTDINAGSETEFMDSDLIDSIVNTMKCVNAEDDLQKVINDFDNLSKSPLLTTSSSSVSSTSLTSPLKSPTPLLSTPDSSSPLKSRSTPQGFRKRLIHQINCEKNGPSSAQNIPTQDSLPSLATKSADNFAVLPLYSTSTIPISVSLTVPLSLVSATATLTTSVTTNSEGTSQNISTFCKLSDGNKNLAHSLPASISASDKDQLPPQFTETVDELALSLYSLEEETDLVLDSKACSFSSMTDIDLGLKDEAGQQFFHKIYKRKRKFKARKSTTADSDVKLKTKKLQAADVEGGIAKPRLRKTFGSGDSEGGTNRTKQKKNVLSENEGALAKVRPPPKKRAKMELVLLQAEDPEKHKDSRCDNLKSEVEGTSNESKKKREGENCKILDSRCNANSSPSDGMKESLHSDVQLKVKKSSEGVKAKSQRNSKTQNDVTQLSDLEMEMKLTLMLRDLTETSNLKKAQFSCKLCQTKFRSARRTIRHMKSHGLPQENALENIAIQEKDSDQEACDVCGYRTKDQSYHYMHIHKYFKHGVPLPLGWSTDKCEICGKECFNKFQLKEHMMSHDDSHCFVCRHCGQSFKMRNALNSHIFHKHCDIRKHQCKVCEKTFKTWTQLKVHVRSHTGERPFACIDCGHRSTTQGNMKLHLTKHGYSKEVIQKLMEQISKNVPEMNQETLEKVMLSVAEKAKDEQTTVKDKKRLKKPDKDKTDSDAQRKPDNKSPTKEISPESSRKNKTKKNSKEQKITSVSKFAGSQIERLLTQPLSELKPPKFILPQPSQTSTVFVGNNSNVNEESVHSQMFCDSTDSGLGALNLLLQQQNQKQETSGLTSGMFFIPLPHTDQRQQQQQQRLQQQVTSMMGYTVIPTHVLPGHNSTESSLDPSACLALPVFSISDVLPSGLNLVHSGVPSLQLVQADSVYPNIATSSSIQNSQDSDTTDFLNSAQGHEVLQNSSVSSLHYPDSKILVTDSTKQEAYTDTFPTLISTSGTTIGTTTIMVLPNVKTTSQSQQLNQVPAIFSYPPLISSGQSVLLPSTPDAVQMTPTSLDTSNFVNFSVTMAAPEEVVTLNMSQQDIGNMTGITLNMSQQDIGNIEEVTLNMSQQEIGNIEEVTLNMSQEIGNIAGETENDLIEAQEDDMTTSTVSAVNDDSGSSSSLVAYTVVKRETDS